MLCLVSLCDNKSEYKKRVNVCRTVCRNVDSAISNNDVTGSTIVFADKKKCEDNHNNNCNDKHKTQKIEAKNKCKIENENKDHSSKNDNSNELACVNLAANLDDAALIFGLDGFVRQP